MPTCKIKLFFSIIKSEDVKATLNNLINNFFGDKVPNDEKEYMNKIKSDYEVKFMMSHH